MKKLRPLLSVAAVSLLLMSCIESENPLSDPQKSKPDDRLTGVWRFRGDSGEMNYYHIGHVGEKLPASVMQVIFVQHMTDGRMGSRDLLAFPTTIGDKNYLNVADIDTAQVKLLEEKELTNEAGDDLFSKDVLRLERVK